MGRGWWWRGAALAASLVVVVTEGRAAELRRLESSGGAGGARVALELSSAVPVAVREVRTASGGLGRLYVDLPVGTQLAPGVPRTLAEAGPIVGGRMGAGDEGAPRLVVQVEDGATYRVARARGGALVTLEVTAPARAAPPRRAVAAAPAPARARRGPPRPKIVIDPGHGGRDPGASGYVEEKVVTLAIARRLAMHLRERLGAETILTRDDDATLALPERTARANAEGADLFVSIHANASPNRGLAGIETYYLNNSNDRATIRLAAMENGLAYVPQAEGGTELRYILSDLLQVGKIEESVTLARTVQRTLVGHLGRRYPGIVDLGVKEGPFYVLVGAHMPCVLVEASFLTNPVEGRRLATEAYQDAVAEGLYSGIAAFLADARRARTL